MLSESDMSLYNRAGESWQKTYFDKCYWLGRLTGGFSGRPYGKKEFEREGETLVIVPCRYAPRGRTYVHPARFLKLDPAEREKHFTFNIGDIMLLGAGPDPGEGDLLPEIFSSGQDCAVIVKAGRPGRGFLAHWQVEGV